MKRDKTPRVACRECGYKTRHVEERLCSDCADLYQGSREAAA